MAVSLDEATTTLLSGKTLTWEKYAEYKAGKLILDTSQKRRLLKLLLQQDPKKVATADESLFPAIIEAWNDKESDPATEKEASTNTDSKETWLLERIEASGFGGLTIFGGKPFDLWVNGKNWCLEGQNGSGKTSLVSAILWAITGKRIREQDGPIEDHGKYAPVYNNEGKEIAQWPPLVSYPAQLAQFSETPEVWVRLTFKSNQGNSAVAYRHVSCSPTNPTITFNIDETLTIAPQLVETGLLMPARLTTIGFGDKSQSLYDAVKMLTGLDQLADIAEGCGNLTHGARRFLKYGKDNGIELHKSKYDDQINNAGELATASDIELPKNIALTDKDAVQNLRSAADTFSKQAGEDLALLRTEISSEVDIATLEGRTTIKNAVSEARTIANQKKGIQIFEAWAALKEASSNDEFQNLTSAISDSKDTLSKALAWHQKQIQDAKFRLKALAAQTYTPTHDQASHCPLCISTLSSAEQLKLAAELEELREHAESAEKKIDDVCRNIEANLTTLLPPAIKQHDTMLSTMCPKESFTAAMLDRFYNDPPFSNILTGLANCIHSLVAAQEASLPSFSFEGFESDKTEPDVVQVLRSKMHSLERLVALVNWWSHNRESFVNAWQTVSGIKQDDDTYPNNSIEGQLVILEQTLAKADPLDKLSKHLTLAADRAEKWQEINTDQEIRNDIAKSLEPLKELKNLVGAETANSIAQLSTRIKSILERIHLREKLKYEDTALEKKLVHVLGSFEEGLHINSSLVANTSWLRAILWSFTFALREETIDALGFNPFPLAVFDDPQTTFDPRNKRKWAQEIVRLANLDINQSHHMQLMVTTHERQFYQCIMDHERLEGEQGLIRGVNKVAGVATIVNGSCLQRVWDEANAKNDDALAREYIADIRVYCEDLLKFMLRGEGSNIQDLSLDGLKNELKRLRESHVPPFNRKAFTELFNTLNGGGGKELNLINQMHHKDDESYGIAEAIDVKAFWEKTLREQIHKAFIVYDKYESFYGEPRTFAWADNVVSFPSGFKEELRQVQFQHTGIAAAAKTDGRAGNGEITVRELKAQASIFLPNHEVYQLSTGTFNPVANIGDVVIVKNHGQINPSNLVVATYDNSLLARRYNQPEAHPEIAVLSGQSVDPYDIPKPIIVSPEVVKCKKVVGTIFATHLLPSPQKKEHSEVIAVEDFSIIQRALKNVRLFKVEGRSAEPVALNGQYLITKDLAFNAESIQSADNRLVIAIAEDGARYFKRLQLKGSLALLESLNPDGTSAAEILSLDESQSFPKLTNLLEVVGVLFELPDSDNLTYS